MSRALTLPRPRPVTAGAASLIWIAAAGHVVLGIALELNRNLATLHAWGALALGVYYALGSRTPERAVYMSAYIAGAEVLWRMTHAKMFWEYGKYASALLLLLAMLRMPVRRGFSTYAQIYFVLLLPSCLFTIQRYGLIGSRSDVSFNLSGPFALAVAVLFFSGCNIRRLQLDRLLRHLLFPTIGIFSVAAYSTLTAGSITFTASSNVVTSGGYGPNQVSSVLGMGALIALLLAIHARVVWQTYFLLGVSVVLVTQTLLTFSRGGVLNVIVCAIALCFHYIQHRRLRQALVGLMIAILVFGSQLLLPKINSWTGGSFKERYTSTDTTGRDQVIRSDLQIFRENPVFGVGPGLASRHREGFFTTSVSSHTEYTRLLAEHGLLGLVAGLILLAILLQAYRTAPGFVAKNWAAVFGGWSLTVMAHAGMRIAAISFLFGLATLRWSQPAARPRQRV